MHICLKSLTTTWVLVYVLSCAPSTHSAIPANPGGNKTTRGSNNPLANTSGTLTPSGTGTTGTVPTIPGATLTVTLGPEGQPVPYHIITIQVPSNTVPSGGSISIQAQYPTAASPQSPTYYPVCPDPGAKLDNGTYDTSTSFGTVFTVNASGQGTCNYYFQVIGQRNLGIFVKDSTQKVIATSYFSVNVPQYSAASQATLQALATQESSN